MSELFNDLVQGLEEAIAYEKGNGNARINTYTILPVKEYSPDHIRELRMKLRMTQKVFAAYMGVSAKTVEAWEHGTTHPSGSAFRLMEIVDRDASQDIRFVIKEE